MATTRGVLYVHTVPSALCPHVEWAAGGILGVPVKLDWTPQPAAAGMYRAELSWQAATGTAAKLVSVLRGWNKLRFEVTEEPSPGVEGERYSFTPDLGIFRATIGPHGDIMVPEERLKSAMRKAIAGEVDFTDEVERLLGQPWDDELEPFRYAGDGAPVRWLHQVV